MNKKRVFIFVLLFLLLSGAGAGGYYYFYKYKPSLPTQSVGEDIFSAVSTGEMLSSIKVLGETNLLQEQKLKFNIEGNVVGVYVSEGKKVTAGELLAELDKGQLQNELKEANIKLENAKINLDKVKDKFSQDDRVRLLNELDDKKRKLELAEYEFTNLSPNNADKLKEETLKIQKQLQELDALRSDIVNQKSKLQTELKTSQSDYNYKVTHLPDEKWKLQNSISDEQKSLTTKTQDYYKSIREGFNDIKNDVDSIKDMLDTSNGYLGIDNEKRKVEYNSYFGGSNSIARGQCESYYWSIKNKNNILESKLLTYDENKVTLGDIVTLLGTQKDLYNAIYIAMPYCVKAAENSIENQSFTSGDISGAKSFFSSTKTQAYSKTTSITDTIKKFQDAETPEILSVKSKLEVQRLTKELQDLDENLATKKTEIDSLLISIPTKMSDLDYSLQNAELSYKQALKAFDDFKYKLGTSSLDKKSELKTLKLDYETSMKDFNKKYLSQEKPEEITIAENDVKQAQIAIDQVNKKIENYELRAPFDGVIDSFALKVGDKLTNSSSTDDKYINLVNPSLMEIKIKLDQIDVVKIKKGIEAQVTFDSYPDRIFTGSLGSPDSKPIDENGIKKYQVKMIIDKGDLNIFSGMSANIDIVLEKIPDATLVPTMSVEMDEKSGMPYVTLKKNGKKVKQTVEVGMNGNGMTQILSGVTIGDEVLEVNFDANVFKPEDFVQPSYPGAIY